MDEPSQPDDRLIRDTGLEARLYGVIAPVAADLGMRVVRVKLSGRNGLTLQIMAERLDGSMTVSDCEVLSNGVSPVLDVEDLIDRAYHLEVSSPGIDRPLTREADFVNWAGHLAKVQSATIIDGRKRFTGFLGPLQDGAVTLLPAPDHGGGTEPVAIPLDAVTEAHLVLTEDLIADALKRDKAIRKGRGLPEDDEFDEVSDEESDAANDNTGPDA